MSLRDDINVPLIVVLGIVTGLIVAVAIVGTQAGYNYVTARELQRNYLSAEQSGNLNFGKNVWATQDQALAAPASWATTQKSAARIPLNEAVERMVASKGKAGQPAAPAPTPTPTAAPAPGRPAAGQGR